VRVTQGHRQCYCLIQQVRLPLYAYSLPSLATTSSVEFCLQFSDNFVNICTQIFCVSVGATETWEDEKTAITTMISAHRKITGFTDQRQRQAVTTTTSGATWRMKLQRQLRFLVTCSSSRICQLSLDGELIRARGPITHLTSLFTSINFCLFGNHICHFRYFKRFKIRCCGTKAIDDSWLRPTSGELRHLARHE